MQIVRFLQILTLENVMKDDLGVREICFALDVSHNCSFPRRKKLTVQPKIDFTVRSKAFYSKLDQFGAAHQTETDPSYKNFLDYCEMNEIVILEITQRTLGELSLGRVDEFDHCCDARRKIESQPWRIMSHRTQRMGEWVPISERG